MEANGDVVTPKDSPEKNSRDSAASDRPRQAAGAIFCHLAALMAFLIPFGNLLGPFIVYMAQKDADAKVWAHGRASLNFQLTISLLVIVNLIALVLFMGSGGYMLYSLASEGLSGSLVSALIANWGIVIFLALSLSALVILNLVMVVINSIRAYDGKDANYWPSFQFFSEREASRSLPQ